MELTVYLGTKVHEQLESQTACLLLCPACTPPWAPPPPIPQVPSQPPSCSHRKGWLVGEGEGTVPCLHCHGQGSEASSPLHLGALKRLYSFMGFTRAPCILPPRAGAAIPDLEDIRWEGTFKVIQDHPIRALALEQPLTHFDHFTSCSPT